MEAEQLLDYWSSPYDTAVPVSQSMLAIGMDHAENGLSVPSISSYQAKIDTLRHLEVLQLFLSCDIILNRVRLTVEIASISTIIKKSMAACNLSFGD